MAYLKIKAQSGTIKSIRNYLEKDERAEEVTGLNVNNLDNWDNEMIAAKVVQRKTDGVQFYHLIQSFDPQDGTTIDKDKIHQCGVELTKKLSEQGYQVVVVTHADKEHIHNHIIVNSVNQVTGKKLQLSKAKTEARANKFADVRFYELTKLNDEICRKHGLMTLDESKARKDKEAVSRGEQPTTRGKDENYLKDSWKQNLREGLQQVWNDRTVVDGESFATALEKQGIKISRVTGTGNITYVDRAGNKARATGLGEFNRDDVSKLFEKNRQLRIEAERCIQEAKKVEQEQKQKINFVRREKGGMSR